ncbi:15677_t:CDS:2, partial [Racocetra persica]
DSGVSIVHVVFGIDGVENIRDGLLQNSEICAGPLKPFGNT